MSVNPREIMLEDILRLSAEERKQLIVRIVHTFEGDGGPPLTPEQEAYLDDLLADFDASPLEGRPWREVMDEIRDKYLSNT